MTLTLELTPEPHQSDIDSNDLSKGEPAFSELHREKIVYARPEAFDHGLDPRFEDLPLKMTGRSIEHVGPSDRRVWEVKTPAGETLLLTWIMPDPGISGEEVERIWDRLGARGVYASRPDSETVAREIREQEDARSADLLKHASHEEDAA